jgi:integrase
MGSHKGYSIFRRKGEDRFTTVVANNGRGRNRSMRFRSRAVANAWGAKTVFEVERIKAGIISYREDEACKAANRDIAAHIDAFTTDLRQKGNTERHVAQTKRRVDRLIKLASIRSLNDISSERVQKALSQIADDSSPQNARGYWTSTKTFINFCIRTDRLLENPAKGVRPPKSAGEVFSRSPFSHDDIRALLIATEARPPARRSHEPLGRDRAMYYQTMAVTGFRRSEAASLTPESFDLIAGEVSVAAGYAKNGRERTVPLRADYVSLFAAFLADNPKGVRIWPFRKHFNLTKMFKRDLAAAGLAAGAGERMGMHSLRRYFGTNAARQNFAAAVILLGHSDPKLTRDYLDVTMADQRAAVNNIPASPLAEQLQQRKAE